MADLLRLENVSKVYTGGLTGGRSTIALRNFSMTLKEDEPTILTVAGESGSGKTTLAMLLLGFITPSAGQIIYRGKNVASLHGKERLAYRREVQAVFQDPFAVFNPFYTVDHLLSVPIKHFKLAKSKADARDKDGEGRARNGGWDSEREGQGALSHQMVAAGRGQCVGCPRVPRKTSRER